MRLSLPAWLAGSADSTSSSSGAPAPPPPPDAAARAASREAAAKIARKLASAAEDIPNGAAAGEVSKPYTVPPGFKAPTMGEQFRYVSGGWGGVGWGGGASLGPAAAFPAAEPACRQRLVPLLLPPLHYRRPP